MGEPVQKARIAWILLVLILFLPLLPFAAALLMFPSALIMVIAVPVLVSIFGVFLVVSVVGYFGLTYFARRVEEEEGGIHLEPEEQPDDIWKDK